MHMKQLLALALSAATAEAAYKGFNYGNKNDDNSARTQSDFESQFKTAKNLVGTSGFTSARLYTMIQAYTTNTPIEAIPAAIEENVSLLLGLWASGDGRDKEIEALKSAISQYGDSFTKLVVGISVGSEDLYRNSVTGVQNDDGAGLDPDVLVDFIKQVKETISGTSLSGAPIGHVDTWDAWTNSSNSAVIDQLDWLGFDTYPYWQYTDDNSIDNAKPLFDEALDKTKAVANGKEVWITETGWPTVGKTEGKAVANTANAKQYWDTVGCPLFGNTNTWWYTLEDGSAQTQFGVTGADLSTTPLYNLACSNTTSSSSASGSSSTGKSSSKTIGSKVGSASASISASASAFRSKGAHVTSSFSTLTSTPLVATKTAAATSGSTGSASSGSSSGSTGSGSGSGSGSSGSSGSSASSASSSSSTPDQINGAGRTSGSIFGAVVAALALAIVV